MNRYTDLKTDRTQNIKGIIHRAKVIGQKISAQSACCADNEIKNQY